MAARELSISESVLVTAKYTRFLSYMDMVRVLATTNLTVRRTEMPPKKIRGIAKAIKAGQLSFDQAEQLIWSLS